MGLGDVLGAVLTLVALGALAAGGYLLALLALNEEAARDPLRLAVAWALCATAEGVLLALALGVAGALQLPLALGLAAALAAVLAWVLARRGKRAGDLGREALREQPAAHADAPGAGARRSGHGSAPRPVHGAPARPGGGGLAAHQGLPGARAGGAPRRRRRGAARAGAPAALLGQPDVSPAARRELAAGRPRGAGVRAAPHQLLWLPAGQRLALALVVDGALAQRPLREPGFLPAMHAARAGGRRGGARARRAPPLAGGGVPRPARAHRDPLRGHPVRGRLPRRDPRGGWLVRPALAAPAALERRPVCRRWPRPRRRNQAAWPALRRGARRGGGGPGRLPCSPAVARRSRGWISRSPADARRSRGWISRSSAIAEGGRG